MVKFSIITVCLNAGSDLIDTVNNILDQSYDNFELIIKDGLSTDGSIEKLPKDDRIKLIVKKDNAIFDAMNQGIDESSGNYLIFMNAGDKFYDVDVLKKYNDFITKNPADFYYGRWYDRKLGVLTTVPKKMTKFYCYCAMPCHQTFAFNKRCFRDKKYDTQYKICADWDIVRYLIMKKGFTALGVPFVVADYEGNGVSASANGREMISKESSKQIKNNFTRAQQIKYKILETMTLPKLRKKIYSNPKIYKLYTSFSKLIFRSK